MKVFLQKMGISLLVGLVLPAVLFYLWFQDEKITEQSPTPAVPEQASTAYTLPILMDGAPREMELEDYVLGVVLGEMPMSFEPEALKAQAVVARTYTMRAYLQGSKHRDAAVCTEANCCQAYLSPEEYLQKGGTQEKLDRLQNLLQDTEGQVLTYGGELILAAYFSCSGGSTEDAAAVWGQELPYLQATASPGEENAGVYYDSLTFSARELEDRLGITLTGTGDAWVSSLTHTEGGGVAAIVIGGETFTGTELRQKLGLRSTVISLLPGKQSMTFETKGFGHRVGMSQYGADAMAAKGAEYAEILAHYYAGTELAALSELLTKEAS